MSELHVHPCDPTRASRRVTRDLTEEVVFSAPPAILCPGQRLAGTPYFALRLVGQGGMGEVY